MNFKDIGLNPTQPTQAFKKIRSHSKIYTNNIAYVPTNLTTKYSNLNNLYLNNTNLIESFNYGTRRQHNLSSSAATTSNYSTFLDTQARSKFLDYTLGFNQQNFNADLGSSAADSLVKSKVFNTTTHSSQMSDLLSVFGNDSRATQVNALVTYPSLLNTLNDDSDKKLFLFPHTKASNPALLLGKQFLNTGIQDYSTSNLLNTDKNYKIFDVSSSNQGILGSEHSIRQFSRTSPSRSDFNLSSDLNSLTSNLHLFGSNALGSVTGSYALNQVNG